MEIFNHLHRRFVVGIFFALFLIRDNGHREISGEWAAAGDAAIDECMYSILEHDVCAPLADRPAEGVRQRKGSDQFWSPRALNSSYGNTLRRVLSSTVTSKDRRRRWQEVCGAGVFQVNWRRLRRNEWCRCAYRMFCKYPTSVVKGLFYNNWPKILRRIIHSGENPNSEEWGLLMNQNI